MKILVVGSGGREHTLVWKLLRDPKVDRVYCAPGNAGIEQVNILDMSASDKQGLLDFAKNNNIDLTVVGPEVPLVDGIVNDFTEAGLTVFGPTKGAAMLEGSKSFAKDFMNRHNIPTAGYKTFTDSRQAAAYIEEVGAPIVVKASGLAAGKGVIMCENQDDAIAAVKDIMEKAAFGDAGNSVVIEEMMVGEEASILAISDGKEYIVLPSSQDHKRIYDNDEGPNTGGMGAYSPAPVVTPELLERIKRDIVSPTIESMAAEGAPFKGVLYVGLMITEEGPKVVEYNVRFGDPEAQAVLPLLEDNFAEMLLASARGDISGFNEIVPDRSAVCVVAASGGYPGSYQKGAVIEGLESVETEDIVIFHAGTKSEGDHIVTSGGRVLGVTAIKETLGEAIEAAYDAVSKIKFEGIFYRKDIGKRGMRRIEGELK